MSRREASQESREVCQAWNLGEHLVLEAEEEGGSEADRSRQRRTLSVVKATPSLPCTSQLVVTRVWVVLSSPCEQGPLCLSALVGLPMPSIQGVSAHMCWIKRGKAGIGHHLKCQGEVCQLHQGTRYGPRGGLQGHPGICPFRCYWDPLESKSVIETNIIAWFTELVGNKEGHAVLSNPLR